MMDDIDIARVQRKLLSPIGALLYLNFSVKKYRRYQNRCVVARS